MSIGFPVCQTSLLHSLRTTAEAQNGMISQILKDRLFNSAPSAKEAKDPIIPEGALQKAER